MSYFPFSLNWYAFYDDIETTIKYEKKKKIQEVLQEKSQFREWANSFKGRLPQMGQRGFQRGWNL